jgi:MFS family permease
MVDAPARSAFGLLRQDGAFRALWASRAVSFVGGSLSLVALILYVADRVGSGLAVALLLLVGEFVPTLFSPVAGALADRLAPRRLMVVCELGQAAVVAVIALLLPSLGPLLALIAAKTVFAVLFEPAGRAALPRLVPDADLEPANAALGIGTHGLDVAGPLLAAALLPVLGVRGVLWVDVASFVVSALLLTRLPRLPGVPRPDGESPAGVWAEARAGLRYLAGHRRVRAIAVGFWLVVACVGLDDVVLVFLAKHTLHAGDVAVSFLYAGVGLGLMVGFLALSRAGRRRPAAVLAVAGLVLSSAGNLLTGLAWAVAVAVVTQAVRGVGLAMIDTGLPATIARSVPAHLRGRVFAVVYGGVSLAAMASSLIGGVALAVASPRLVLVVAGGSGVVAALATGATLGRQAPGAAGAPDDTGTAGTARAPDDTGAR